jgi:LPS sulfotransferase NodH
MAPIVSGRMDTNHRGQRKNGNANMLRDALRDALRSALEPAESLLLGLGKPVKFRPVFIVSPPRSGSTLLYLLLIQRFRFSYFSNFAMSCPASPGTLTVLGAPFGVCMGGTRMENNFGETRGWNGPNQGYRTWNRWLAAQADYIDPVDISETGCRRLRQTIGLIESAVNAPFINKWQKNATRIQAIHTVFPEAVFVHLRRDRLLTAQSILLARRKLKLSQSEWFSAKPRNYITDPSKSDLRQAAEQVALLELELEQDKALIGAERFFELNYEDLCKDLGATLTAFANWYGAVADTPLRERQKVVDRLNESNSIRISDQEVAEIISIFGELDGRFDQARADIACK